MVFFFILNMYTKQMYNGGHLRFYIVGYRYKVKKTRVQCNCWH